MTHLLDRFTVLKDGRFPSQSVRLPEGTRLFSSQKGVSGLPGRVQSFRSQELFCKKVAVQKLPFLDCKSTLLYSCFRKIEKKKRKNQHLPN